MLSSVMSASGDLVSSPGAGSLSKHSPDSFADADEKAARRLEATGSYRFLRRLPTDSVPSGAAEPNRPLALLFARGGSSGPRPDRRRYAALLTTYDHEGVRDTVAAFSGASTKPEEVTENDCGIHDPTGLSDASLQPFRDRITMMVHHESPASMARVVSMAPALRSLPIVTSRAIVPWETFGVDGSGLDAILAAHGVFADTETAEGACQALAAILRTDMWRRWSRSPLPYVLKSLAERRVRVKISGPTYAARDALKSRGYRWSTGQGSIPKGWFLDLPKAAADIEIVWVATWPDLADATASISDTPRN